MTAAAVSGYSTAHASETARPVMPSSIGPEPSARPSARAYALAVRALRMPVVRFVLVGGAATVVHAGSTVLLIEGFGMASAGLAAALGAVAGMATSYLGNWAWTFRAAGSGAGGHGRYLPRFLAAYLLVLAFNALTVHVLADRMGVPYAIPLALALSLSPVLTFLLNRHFVFVDARQA